MVSRQVLVLSIKYLTRLVWPEKLPALCNFLDIGGFQFFKKESGSENHQFWLF
jgi:hypothetical protein